MGLLRLAAIVLFLAAALSFFGWIVHLTTAHALGCIATGLLCGVLSGVSKAELPVRG